MSASPTQLEYSRHRNWIAFVALLEATAAFFLHPLGVLLFVCLVAVVYPTDDLKWFFLVAACTVFMILNVSKQIDGDLVNYVTLQDYISQQPITALLDKNQLQTIQGTYRLTEIGFYAPFWMLSLVIPDAKTAIDVGATLGIYLPTFLALLMIGKSERWNNGMLLTVVIFTFFAGVNFLQCTHLIRQYMSGALLFYAFASFISGRKLLAAAAAIYSCSIHNGTAPLVVLLLAVAWMFRYDGVGKRGFWGISFRLIFLAILFGATMAAVPLLQGTFIKEDVPNIKVGHFIVVGVFFLIAQSGIKMQKLRSRTVYYATRMFVAVYALSLGFFVLGLALFALRYFIYLEWLYGLLVGAMLFNWFRGAAGMQVMTRFAVSMAATAILVARIMTSEWMYGPGDNYLLTWDFFQVSQLVSR